MAQRHVRSNKSNLQQAAVHQQMPEDLMTMCEAGKPAKIAAEMTMTAYKLSNLGLCMAQRHGRSNKSKLQQLAVVLHQQMLEDLMTMYEAGKPAKIAAEMTMTVYNLSNLASVWLRDMSGVTKATSNKLQSFINRCLMT